MKIDILKLIFTVYIYFLIFIAVYVAVPEDGGYGIYAATYALITSAVFFVRLLPGQGMMNHWSDLALSYIGAATAFLAAWYWLQSAGGIQSLIHAAVVISVLVIIIIVIAISLFKAKQIFNQGEAED